MYSLLEFNLVSKLYYCKTSFKMAANILKLMYYWKKREKCVFDTYGESKTSNSIFLQRFHNGGNCCGSMKRVEKIYKCDSNPWNFEFKLSSHVLPYISWVVTRQLQVVEEIGVTGENPTSMATFSHATAGWILGSGEALRHTEHSVRPWRQPPW